MRNTFTRAKSSSRLVRSDGVTTIRQQAHTLPKYIQDERKASEYSDSDPKSHMSRRRPSASPAPPRRGSRSGDPAHSSKETPRDVLNDVPRVLDFALAQDTGHAR